MLRTQLHLPFCPQTYISFTSCQWNHRKLLVFGLTQYNTRVTYDRPLQSLLITFILYIKVYVSGVYVMLGYNIRGKKPVREAGSIDLV
jgi:hypothetical protein